MEDVAYAAGTRAAGMRRVGRRIGRAFATLRGRLRGGGAGESGLFALTELSFVSTAGDALVAVALAGSQFFSLPIGEARSRIALYLLITFAPFTLIAPVVGPVLDRFTSGRRVAMAAICLGRGMIAWTLAGSLHSLSLYPLALGSLVLSKAYGVARAAVVPRVVPPGRTLVAVNSRLSLTGIAGGAVAAPVGVGAVWLLGYGWMLRLCAVVFFAGAVLAFRQPARVDDAGGEGRVTVVRRAAATGPGRMRRALGALPVALRGAASLRVLSGFLTLFLAFQLRTHGGNNTWLGALFASASVGSAIGTFAGGRLSRRRPEQLIVFALLLATAGCVLAAVDYSKLTSLFAALLATIAGSMGKLGLDAIVQRDVREDIRNSTFARTETAWQLAWVLGGAIGLIDMPVEAGFALAAAGMAVVCLSEVASFQRFARSVRRSRGRDRGPAYAPSTVEVPPAPAPYRDTVPMPAEPVPPPRRWGRRHEK